MKYKSYTAWVLALLCFVLLRSTAFAQEKNDDITPLTQSGSAMFMFSLNGPLTFGLSGPSANGSGDPRVIAGAGMKYYISDRLAGRLLLSFGSNSSGPDSAKTSSSVYGIGLGLEYHCHDVYSISPYFGGGIGFITGSATTDTISELVGGTSKGTGVNPLASNITSTKNTTTAFAVSALAGFDWFFTKSMAIGSEFSLGFVSGSRSQTVASTTTNLPSTTAFGFSTIGNVHLLVYF